MLAEPNCSKRGCKHFRGVKIDGDDETTERCICAAFPDQIPDDIAYGPNKHLKPVKGDNGILFEKGTPIEE